MSEVIHEGVYEASDPETATKPTSPPTDLRERHERPPSRVVLSREDIFRASDIVTEWVDVPEWGGGLYVRGMTAGERDALEASLLTDKGKRNMDRLAQFRSRVLLLCCVDDAGRRIFQPTDIQAISKKSMVAVERILDVAQRLSGMTEEDVDSLTGNSDGQGDESSSI